VKNEPSEIIISMYEPVLCMTRRVCHWVVFASFLAPGLSAQSPSARSKSYTWQELKEKFEAANPTLRAGQLNIDESRAMEVTAFLRPNPDVSLAADQFNFHPLQPFAGADQIAGITYLHEREHKRELRRDAAVQGTRIAVSQQEDLERTLLFSLRGAYVNLLQAKAVLANAKENLEYYDRELEINRSRLKAGDIAEVDDNRLELQRVQFESDFETADVSLRTAKIQLLALLNDRTPLDQFDVTGNFDFNDSVPPLEELRAMALDSRPDLKAQVETVEQARTNYKLAVANGSADPTFGFDAGRNPPLFGYVGFSVSLPLRIFDKNQGEKTRTNIDITRNQRLLDASRAQVYSDVDSAYATLNSTLNLLRPYKSKYLTMATKVRDTVSFAYQRGAATLLDYLDAQKSYRDVHLAYLNLIGSYLTAVSQADMAVGREAIP
jgi:cobalt-zinc-cadmium efflux system outer membrane protein